MKFHGRSSNHPIYFKMDLDHNINLITILYLFIRNSCVECWEMKTDRSKTRYYYIIPCITLQNSNIFCNLFTNLLNVFMLWCLSFLFFNALSISYLKKDHLLRRSEIISKCCLFLNLKPKQLLCYKICLSV